ncbi:hypothetical protein D8B23_18530 [Verminephrobacter aporrectodeae subsp. tuberculatae]|uniref:Uncharacterized protein n=1 Tax=Verminephrobacter aporrectodeae subsp. tuberculatae TaxID=1110392 RepID=A0ABT3KXZ3_9BURK|nr:hypothetical protein [Verminephrobacter aporrectodeae subsp. tuberculatae]MCW5323205.1 hypothetical protein [Verminephrobacter aporrectodeae subsp. tuberculatae]MCW8177271.1 hypothetical protein [Verminephrobacter aporrectodeae subsp. tuberculatae]MCW8200343.1 hypothetical protein [Verminephrobacter aporrectodeae subsp. tuberculatae]MCW8204695.1 hypothetical protein [Verminephrobacter aporrectodeae subsp. tuberculatae]
MRADYGTQMVHSGKTPLLHCYRIVHVVCSVRVEAATVGGYVLPAQDACYWRARAQVIVKHHTLVSATLFRVAKQ